MAPRNGTGSLPAALSHCHFSPDRGDTETFTPHSDSHYSCQLLQQTSTKMNTFWVWRVFFSSFPFPFQLFLLQKWVIPDWCVVMLHLLSTTFSLPSSGPAEAPSESTACRSPVSELFSSPLDWAPSVRHPLEVDLKGELRRSRKNSC